MKYNQLSRISKVFQWLEELTASLEHTTKDGYVSLSWMKTFLASFHFHSRADLFLNCQTLHNMLYLFFPMFSCVIQYLISTVCLQQVWLWGFQIAKWNFSLLLNGGWLANPPAPHNVFIFKPSSELCLLLYQLFVLNLPLSNALGCEIFSHMAAFLDPSLLWMFLCIQGLFKVPESLFVTGNDNRHVVHLAIFSLHY